MVSVWSAVLTRPGVDQTSAAAATTRGRECGDTAVAWASAELLKGNQAVLALY